MNEIIFNDKEMVKTISLKDLGKTVGYESGKKHAKGHYDMYNDVMQDLNNRGFDAKLGGLFVPKKGVVYPDAREVRDKKYLTSKHDIHGVIVNTMLGKIDIAGKEFDDGNSNQSIAIGFNGNGMQIAFGQNVQICQNMCIMNGQTMSNYGSMAMPFMRIMDLLAVWIQNMRKTRERDMEIFSALKSKEIENPLTEVREIAGHLNELRLRNIKKTTIVAPLSQSGINIFQEQMINFEGELATGYDIYQASTFASSRLNNVALRMNSSSDLGSFFQRRYNCEIEAVIEDAETVEVV